MFKVREVTLVPLISVVASFSQIGADRLSTIAGSWSQLKKEKKTSLERNALKTPRVPPKARAYDATTRTGLPILTDWELMSNQRRLDWSNTPSFATR